MHRNSLAALTDMRQSGENRNSFSPGYWDNHDKHEPREAALIVAENTCAHGGGGGGQHLAGARLLDCRVLGFLKHGCRMNTLYDW